jgi:hypothetical protein
MSRMIRMRFAPTAAPTVVVMIVRSSAVEWNPSQPPTSTTSPEASFV